MIEIKEEWIIGVVFGVGVLYALCQIFMGLGKQHDWRGVTIDFGVLFYVGVLLIVAARFRINDPNGRPITLQGTGLIRG